jgi:hypothetical protein
MASVPAGPRDCKSRVAIMLLSRVACRASHVHGAGLEPIEECGRQGADGAGGERGS